MMARILASLFLICVPGFAMAQAPIDASRTVLASCQECGVYGDCNCAADCPSTPLMEVCPATSLFWNDPCCCIEDPCLPPTCMDSQPALWYASVDALMLFRDQLFGDAFQQDGGSLENVLSESSFESEFDAGSRATFGAALGDWYRLEGTYVGSYGWRDFAAVRNSDTNSQGSAGNLFSPFSDFGNPAGILGFDFNDFASIQYSSDFRSAELNLRKRIHFRRDQTALPSHFRPYGSQAFMNNRVEGAFLLGVRYLQIDEQFGYRSESVEPVAAGTIDQINTTTGNDMIGAQIGLLLQMSVHKRCWVDVDLKGGIYQNEVTLNSAFASTDLVGTPISNFAGADTKDVTSWVGELSVIYNYQFAQNFTFRAGYNAVAVADVALASRNFTENVDFLSLGPVLANHRDDIVYHGPSIGLTWTR